MAQKTNRTLGFNSSLLSLNMKGTVNRTCLVLIVLIALMVLRSMRTPYDAGVSSSLGDSLLGVGLFSLGFLSFDYLFVALVTKYPYSLMFDKFLLFMLEGIFVGFVTMTALTSWIVSVSGIFDGSLSSCAVLFGLIAVILFPLRYALGTSGPRSTKKGTRRAKR
jgi:hypothetical protein